jgi:hypothetical protein
MENAIFLLKLALRQPFPPAADRLLLLPGSAELPVSFCEQLQAADMLLQAKQPA